MADKLAAESREQMTEPRLTEEQYKVAYEAWMNVRTRIDDSSRAVIEAIAEHVQYAQEQVLGVCGKPHGSTPHIQSRHCTNWRPVPAAPSASPEHEPRFTMGQIEEVLLNIWHDYCGNFSSFPHDRAWIDEIRTNLVAQPVRDAERAGDEG
jgi:hypothetical protein